MLTQIEAWFKEKPDNFIPFIRMKRQNFNNAFPFWTPSVTGRTRSNLQFMEKIKTKNKNGYIKIWLKEGAE
jgi:hypothetical protein